ncbi:unnamed protein product [Camellia sinensis]
MIVICLASVLNPDDEYLEEDFVVKANLLDEAGM